MKNVRKFIEENAPQCSAKMEKDKLKDKGRADDIFPESRSAWIQ